MSQDYGPILDEDLTPRFHWRVPRKLWHLPRAPPPAGHLPRPALATWNASASVAVVESSGEQSNNE